MYDFDEDLNDYFTIFIRIEPNDRCFLPEGVDFMFHNFMTPKETNFKVFRVFITIMLLSIGSIVVIFY